MATLSFANSIALLGKAVWLLEQQRLYVSANTEKLIDHVADIVAAAEGEKFLQQNTVISERFNSISQGVYNETSVRAFLKPFLDDVSLAIGKPISDYEAQLEDLRQYMVTNSKTIEQRTMSIGSVTANGGNTANSGSILCLSVDKHGNQIQSSVAETSRIEVISAQGAGSLRNAELFKYLGTNKPTGSGINKDFTACYDQNNAIQNGRFNAFFGTTKPTAGVPATPSSVGNFSNWTMSSTSSFRANLDYPYRAPAGASATAYGLSFVADGNITQSLTQAGRTFDKDKPYLPLVIGAKTSSCDGTFTIAWGSKSQAFTVSSTFSTNGTIYIVNVDLDQDLFYRNWMSDSAAFTLTLGSRTTGSLHIIEAGLYTFEEINGLYFAAVGKEAPWQVGDFFTQAISQSADGLIQRWLTKEARVKSGLVLPYSGSPTEADPS